MDDRRLGVVMNGVTGRMGLHQHLQRSVLAIEAAGGVPLSDGTRVRLEPLLVGRDADRLAGIAREHGVDRWTTDLDAALGDPDMHVYFDAQATHVRESGVVSAIKAGKHVYVEKPIAPTAGAAEELVRLAESAGVKHGVVHDKLFLPGFQRLRGLVEDGFFGRVLSVRGEFGYWVFEGDGEEPQRPSWNYRKADGGGITLDMFCHWSYLFENLFAPVAAVTARTFTHIPRRWDENGDAYAATADDAAYAIIELADGTVVQMNSSWCVRVHRDELLELQVDGTQGSAVAGLHGCRVQARLDTPRPQWNPDLPETQLYRDQWSSLPTATDRGNGFRQQWEMFVRHVFDDGPHPHDLASGARGVRLAELALRSSAEGRRMVVADAT